MCYIQTVYNLDINKVFLNWIELNVAAGAGALYADAVCDVAVGAGALYADAVCDVAAGASAV